MDPIKTNESNFVYLGPAPAIADLPCRTEASPGGGVVFSTWALTDEERRIIAAGGHVRLGIYRVRPIPPVSLQVVPNAGPTERVSAPCNVCGKEPDDIIHSNGKGPGIHAYRQRA